MDWGLAPGTQILRRTLHETYGGRPQGGIGPSSKSPNVFLFTDPIAGERHGYFDGWKDDERFHFTGEGQRGDQRMASGNAAILNHAREGRSLRLFQGARGTVTYLGEVALDDRNPWYETDAPETGEGPLRKVIVFRFQFVTATPATLPISGLESPNRKAIASVQSVPIEENTTEKYVLSPSRESTEAERVESALVTRFGEYLRRLGHQVSRLRIVPPGEAKPIFCDLIDDEQRLLVEAKGSVTRESIRMAIGQIADYGRFYSSNERAVLLPSEPRKDLVQLVLDQSISVIWPDSSDTFHFERPPGKVQ